jgi:hypothetical protein
MPQWPRAALAKAAAEGTREEIWDRRLVRFRHRAPMIGRGRTPSATVFCSINRKNALTWTSLPRLAVEQALR